MERPEKPPRPWFLLLLVTLPVGCAALHDTSMCPFTATAPIGESADRNAAGQVSSLKQVSFGVPVQEPIHSASEPEGSPFLGVSELSADAVVEQVLARNPSLAQMTAAWQAASARYPQVTSLDDPMFGATVGPASIREEAKTRYEKGLVPQQDVSQADVELGRQRERGLTLQRMKKVAVARINTLMHRPANEPLPPPPERLALAEALPNADALRARALNPRPDLQGLRNRIVSEEAAMRLALRESYPDFEVMAAYDTIMGNGSMRDLAPQLGVRMNLPIQKERRHAAVAEAQARLAERRAQLDSRIDQVTFQLQETYEQVVESDQVVRLYETTILPAARQNVGDARSAYEAGRIPFLSLIEAQRSQVQLLDRYHEGFAEYNRRRAALERVVGGPLVMPP